MFGEVLREVVERTEGGLAGLLMDTDGIAVDQYTRDGSGIDIEGAGMEYSVVIRSVMRASEMLGAGTASELAVKADRLTIVLRLLNENYFVALALQPGGNIGKARYMLRVRAHQLVQDL